MPYTIPSSTITPGTVYQPRGGLPGVIKSNARAIYATGATAFNSTRMLDLLPSHNGTRRTGEQGRAYTADGVDDEVNFGDIGTAIWFSGWIKLNSDNQCLFSLSNDTNTNVVVSAGVLTAGATLTLTGIKVDDVSKTASEAGALLNDNDWHFLSCGIGDGLGGASTADDVRFFTDGTNHGSVSGFDWRFWSTSPTAAELTEAYNGTSANRNSADLSKYALWSKGDEQDGTIAYDSSGNANHGTITNATLANFHTTQDVWSFQNQVGYNLSGGVYIPRDESDTTNDVLGNSLTYTGKRPNDAALTGSNCLTADGTLYIAATHLTGSETVVSSGGTSTPSISAGQIDFTAGTCWDLTLSDGTHYPLSEGAGIAIHDDSGSENHGVLTNATLATAWGGSQDSYHKNLLEGHAHRMYFDGVDDYVEINDVPSIDFSDSFDITLKIISNSFVDDNYFLSHSNQSDSDPLFAWLTGSNSDNGKVRFLWRNNAYAVQFDIISTGTIDDGEEHTLRLVYDGVDTVTQYIDGVIDGTETNTPSGTFTATNWGIGVLNRATISNYLKSGTIYDVSISQNGLVVSSFNGYGNTDADWTDQIGSNNGTVNGSPSLLRLPAVNSTTGPYSIPLTNPAGNYHNNAETTIDFDPDSTPEMGATQLGITVPASHAFGDAFAASTQIFSRQRTLTEDRFVVMPEAQTGSALATIQKYTQP